jgi:FkbM family methyltransferase
MNPIVQAVRWFNVASPWHQWKPSLAKRVTPMLQLPALPAVYDGVQGDLRMKLDLQSQFERWIYLNIYEIVTLRLVRRLLRPGDAFVDAGANLGLVTLLASRCVGEAGVVYAFEPWPPTLSRLEENLALNPTGNVQLIRKGCWHEATKVDLHEFADGHIGETSMGQLAHKQVGRTLQIQTTRIDDEVPVDRRVRMIKLDIEGAEWGALRGAERVLFAPPPQDRPHIVIELNPKVCKGFDHHPSQVVDWLLQKTPGYRMHVIKSRRSIPITRDRLDAMWQENPQRTYNVWFQSPGR